LANKRVSALAGSIVVFEQGILPQLIDLFELFFTQQNGFDVHSFLEAQLNAVLSFMLFHSIKL
jgi:hypothetical protein